MVGLSMAGSLWLSTQPALALKWAQRWETYHAAFRISLEHPILGVGAGPAALPTLCRLSGMPLPGPHSDWLALILLHGWPATLLLLTLLVRRVWVRRSGLELAAQAGLITLSVAAVGRSVVVHPGYVLAVVVLCSELLFWKGRT